MQDRQPPPSPAAVRPRPRPALDLAYAAEDLALAGLQPAAPRIASGLESFCAAGTREVPSGLRDALRRPLLPVSEAEIARWMDEAREQLSRPDRDGGAVVIGYDGFETRIPAPTITDDGRVMTPEGVEIFQLPSDYRREVLPEYRAAVHMCIGVLNP